METGKYQKLSDNVKEYAQMRYDLLKLELLEKLSLIVSLLLLIVIGVVLAIAALIYASMALIFILKGALGGLVPGFLLMSGVFVAIAVLFFVMKDKWFVNPLVRQLSAILFRDSEKKEASDENT